MGIWSGVFLYIVGEGEREREVVTFRDGKQEAEDLQEVFGPLPSQQEEEGVSQLPALTQQVPEGVRKGMCRGYCPSILSRP